MSLELLDIKELSKEYGFKESWIRKKVFENAIPFYRISRLIRFSKKDIEDWIKSQKQGGSYWINKTSNELVNQAQHLQFS